MQHLETFYIISLITQLFHSVEELSTGFHKKWYLSTMPFWVFLLFEVVFSLFWIGVYLYKDFPYREALQISFLILMFINGIQHVIWWRFKKKYVPGLITAFLHVLIVSIFYFINFR